MSLIKRIKSFLTGLPLGVSCETAKDGTKYWYLDDQLHRDDGPAIENPRFKSWRWHHLKHRLDGPAMEYADGRKEWWVKGKLHRTDGPAIDYPNCKEYYSDDLYHREDGPAVETPDFKAWYIKGKKHRLDGPAEEGQLKTQWSLMNQFGLFGHEYEDVTYKKYYVNDELHRTDGPAIELSNGAKQHYLNGKEAAHIELYLVGKNENSDDYKFCQFILKHYPGTVIYNEGKSISETNELKKYSTHLIIPDMSYYEIYIIREAWEEGMAIGFEKA